MGPTRGMGDWERGEERPLFCPNRGCGRHYPPFPEGRGWYEKWGVYGTGVFGKVQRYRCKECGRTFSTQTFSLDYYSKRVVEYRMVERGLSEGMSEAGVGRWCGVSGQVVRNKVGRLARQAVWSQGKLYGQLGVREGVVADGFESWCRSQYFPGHVNWVVGESSQMVYLQEYVSLRRKGVMREEQRRRREEGERRWKADPRGVESSFERLGEELERWVEREEGQSLILTTDEHPAYVRGLGRVVGLEQLRQEGRFTHRRVSSRRARTRSNPLFAVNYLDREVRKDVANHVRETTRGARNVNDLMNRLAIYRVVHNYRKSYRLRPDKRDTRYHGEVAGLAREVIEQEVG
ncbi:MAG: hypothetical protein N2442_10190, partial [Spirochaetes bacterium]|nr:hypothetical protein [Spirochaetota bacterium]